MTKKTSVLAPGLVQERSPVTEQQLIDAGVDLAKDFPGSSVDDFRQYPVLAEGGWYIVIKHQRTLQTVSRVPWRLLGPISLLSENLMLD
ncbi:MAG: hypothetical protein K2P94_01270 [Rhodospirillaceae bacterium]|nr:hypothetical protein [Rhodospirillaceae bacterium]